MNKFSIQDIISYTAGEMEPEKRILFEKALAEDANLMADLKLYQDVDKTLKSKFSPTQDDILFKENLKQLTAKHFNKSNKPAVKIFRLSKIWYAAALLILGLLVWAPWNKDLYNQYANIEMVSSIERGENNDQQLQQATEAFNNDDFKNAEEKLKLILSKQPENDMLRFYYSVCLIETNNLKAARENLGKVYQKESVFKYDAAFYTALSYLKEKNKEQARKWLLLIPTDADNYNKAQELLEEL